MITMIMIPLENDVMQWLEVSFYLNIGASDCFKSVVPQLNCHTSTSIQVKTPKRKNNCFCDLVILVIMLM